MSDADKERYDKEMEEHETQAKLNPPPPPVKKVMVKGKVVREDGSPKKNLSCYFIFLGEIRPKIKADNPNLSMCE